MTNNKKDENEYAVTMDSNGLFVVWYDDFT